MEPFSNSHSRTWPIAATSGESVSPALDVVQGSETKTLAGIFNVSIFRFL